MNNPYDLVNDYIHGELDAATTQRFESTLAGDPELQAHVREARELTALASSLNAHVQPSRDLWPDIEAKLQSAPTARPGRRAALWGLGAAGVGLAAAALALLAVGVTIMTIDPWGDSALMAQTEAAQTALREGDLPLAAGAYEGLAQPEHAPNSVDVHIGAAYSSLLAGDLELADEHLAKALMHCEDEDERDEITLRRAVVALKGGHLELVQSYGEASNLPQGLVFAAEVYLADAESDAAIPLLRRAIQSRDLRVRQTAKTYLEYLEDVDTGRNQLAEATALWALGQRPEAVQTAQDLLLYMPADYYQRDELLLLWAGRAVTSDEPDIAEQLIDDMGQPPPGQSWRSHATLALVDVARGDHDAALNKFYNLREGGAPADGLADAIATAAAITKDVRFARQLADGTSHPALALRLQDPTLTSNGPLRHYLENR